MVKNEVPSFISSETMRPLLRATTAYTLPRTSAVRVERKARKRDRREGRQSSSVMTSST